MSARPCVLFICARNSGKSQMAAGLMRHVAGDAVDVASAGTAPGTADVYRYPTLHFEHHRHQLTLGAADGVPPG